MALPILALCWILVCYAGLIAIDIDTIVHRNVVVPPAVGINVIARVSSGTRVEVRVVVTVVPIIIVVRSRAVISVLVIRRWPI